MSDQSIHTVFKGLKSDFIKAMVYGRDLEAFKKLGFVESVDLLDEEKPKKEPKIKLAE
jgi:hypothetical protein